MDETFSHLLLVILSVNLGCCAIAATWFNRTLSIDGIMWAGIAACMNAIGIFGLLLI